MKFMTSRETQELIRVILGQRMGEAGQRGEGLRVCLLE